MQKTVDNSPMSSNVQQVQQAVITHHAKTLYFNDLWKGFLIRAGLVVSLFNIAMCFQLKWIYSVSNPISYLFEVCSMTCVVPTTLFVVRHIAALRAFRIAFTLSLLQSIWWMYSLYQRSLGKTNAVDLLSEQWPVGAVFFFVCWVSDRFMLRSAELVEQASIDLNVIGKKLH